VSAPTEGAPAEAPTAEAPTAEGATAEDSAPKDSAPKDSAPESGAPKDGAPESVPAGDDAAAPPAATSASSPAAVKASPFDATARADTDEAPAPRTRTRRVRVAPMVTFQAPEPVVEPEPRRGRRGLTTAPPVAVDAEPTGATPEGAPVAGPAEAGSARVADAAVEPTAQAEPAEPAEDETAVGAETDTDADDAGGTSTRRRRRGRRGRGRARGEDEGALDGDDESAETDADAESADDADDDTSAAASGDDTAGDEEPAGDDRASGGSRRRRRRRRRDGAGDEPSPDDPPITITHVREARESSRGRDDEVRGLSGSTRLEAKRQRRREGRDSGRRRPPIVTEAEFLARRESVERRMVVRNAGDRTQIAVLEDGVLVEHFVTRTSSSSYAGNVYLGRVQNVLASMEAAFVDIGKGRNAVLYAGEVNYDASGLEGRPRKIEQVLKSGQSIVVQVSKDPIGHKGARLTSQISLPGRYLVYVPDGQNAGISRKLPDTERARLKAILKKITPEDGGVIVRTAAEGASEAELERDIDRLAAQWEDIVRKADKASAPALLYGEPDLVIRVIRDIFNEDFTELVVQGAAEADQIENYVDLVAPDLRPRVRRHVGTVDVFAEYRVDEQLAQALDRKVWLPSGGSLVIDRTEAMTVIDVNTGKFTGKGGNLEETVTKNNLEAAQEIVRQLRLRDIGGIIVIDFIDMVLESNRELVLRRLTECLGRDRTRHQVAEVTSLGLVQMTRKRVGQGLLEAYSEQCPHCNGRGVLIHLDGGGHVPAPVPAAPVPPAKPVPAPPSRRSASRAAGAAASAALDEPATATAEAGEGDSVPAPASAPEGLGGAEGLPGADGLPAAALGGANGLAAAAHGVNGTGGTNGTNGTGAANGRRGLNGKGGRSKTGSSVAAHPGDPDALVEPVPVGVGAPGSDGPGSDGPQAGGSRAEGTARRAGRRRSSRASAPAEVASPAVPALAETIPAETIPAETTPVDAGPAPDAPASAESPAEGSASAGGLATGPEPAAAVAGPESATTAPEPAAEASEAISTVPAGDAGEPAGAVGAGAVGAGEAGAGEAGEA